MAGKRSKRRRLRALAILTCVLTFIGAAGPVEPEGDPDATFTRVFALPLTDGRLSMGDVLGLILDETGMDGAPARDAVSAQTDVSGKSARMTLLALEIASTGSVRFDI